jgi:hypothetical protein
MKNLPSNKLLIGITLLTGLFIWGQSSKEDDQKALYELKSDIPTQSKPGTIYDYSGNQWVKRGDEKEKVDAYKKVCKRRDGSYFRQPNALEQHVVDKMTFQERSKYYAKKENEQSDIEIMQNRIDELEDQVENEIHQ